MFDDSKINQLESTLDNLRQQHQQKEHEMQNLKNQFEI